MQGGLMPGGLDCFGRLRGQFAYLVFSTDEATLAAIEELRLRFFRELRALVAGSPRAERVAVTNVQLFAIDVGSPS